MFTGIIEEIGVVKALDAGLTTTRLDILASTVIETLTVGDSISVNGACLTVVGVNDREFSVEVSSETLSVTTLGSLAAGAPLNLERAMKLSDRINGHLVSGHVDGVGVIKQRDQQGNSIVLVIEGPSEILRYCVPKGSVTVDGVSMTINQVKKKSFDIAIIPHTAKVTTLGLRGVGEKVNLEADLIGKYVERLLQGRGVLPTQSAPAIDREYLQKRGLI
ncbi:MAG: riboflavin synthase [Nitrospiraceae bacterium]